MKKQDDNSELIGLQHVIAAQKEALAHWRRQVDEDYGLIQRMVRVLCKTGDYIELLKGTANANQALLTEIDEIINSTPFRPAKTLIITT